MTDPIAPEVFLLEDKGEGLTLLTLNRPEALNAFNSALRRGIAAALQSLNADAAVRGVVITGGGRAFAAGVDLKEARDVKVEEVEGWFGEMRDVYQALRLMDKPVVAAVNGVAAGAGFQIALASDMRVGTPHTRMGQPEINAGIPSVMGAFWMSLHLGWTRNLELSYTGRLMDAEECRALGLLQHLTDPDTLPAKALEVAGELAGKSPTAFMWTKRRYREVTQAAFDDAFRAAVAGQQDCYRNGEPQAAIAAFLDKLAARKGGE